MRPIDADALKKKKKHSYKEFFENVVSVCDIDNAPTIEAEPVKRTIEKFRDYQIEWLTAHNDIEFCEEENLIIRFLKDTAECAIKFGMDEVTE